MKTQTLIASNGALLLVAALLVSCGRGTEAKAKGADEPKKAETAAAQETAEPAPSGPMTGFHATHGSRMRIDGTANMIHTEWRVEGTIIQGSLEVGPNFPTEPGQPASPGKVAAKAVAMIPVNSLKSVKEDGSHDDDKMDARMYEQLKADQFRKIEYRLASLTLKEPAKSKEAPYLFESKGSLAICGVTNQISMPVSVTPLGDKKLKISGAVTVKGSAYNVPPVEKSLGPLGTIRTGDEYKLSFDWLLLPNSPAAAK